MPGYRLDRVTEDIKRELSEILRDMKDPRIKGMVSIVRVTVSPDLSYCKVYVSIMGSDPKETAAIYNKAAGFIRHELSGKLHIRKTPELKFLPDDSIEQSARISKLLSDISKDDDNDDRK